MRKEKEKDFEKVRLCSSPYCWCAEEVFVNIF